MHRVLPSPSDKDFKRIANNESKFREIYLTVHSRTRISMMWEKGYRILCCASSMKSVIREMQIERGKSGPLFPHNTGGKYACRELCAGKH